MDDAYEFELWLDYLIDSWLDTEPQQPPQEDNPFVPIDEFIEWVTYGYIDDDGVGYYVRNGIETREIVPLIVNELVSEQQNGVTHIAWYNK